MKTVVFAQVDQNKITHHPLCIAPSMGFDELVKLDKDFRNSEALKNIFANAEIQTVIIILYTVLGSSEMRRRIGAAKTALDDNAVRTAVTNILKELKIDIAFHEKDELKKILPFSRADRDMLKALLGKGVIR